MLKNYGLMTLAVCSALCAQPAMADINGGGSTFAQPLYQTAGVLTPGFAPYIGADLGRDKRAFLTNDYQLWNPGMSGRNVHWAASESRLTAMELSQYQNAHSADWGRLIQVPSAGTAVAIPFNKPGSAEVNLNVAELCGVFSGRLIDWGQIADSGRVGPITLVYPWGSSATTELFTRFLNAQCSEQGTFAVTTDFSTSYSGGLPAGAEGAVGSAQVMSALNAGSGRITYVSPVYASETLAGLNDATRVARINGVSPAPDNLSAAIASVVVPSMADRANPGKWVPTFGRPGQPDVVPYPTSGYPIIGFSNLMFSQCYADATQSAQVRSFFLRHYGAIVNNDAAIKANRLVPLPAPWKAVVRATFLTASNDLSIGNPNVCNGIGRPL